jgi:hypothetical protein
MSTLEKKCRGLVERWRRLVNESVYGNTMELEDALAQLKAILPRRKPKKGKRK